MKEKQSGCICTPAELYTQPGEKQMKKARFMIPEKMDLTKDQFEEVAPFWHKEGEVCELRQVNNICYWYFDDGSNFSDGDWVWETWLEEIKEESKVLSAQNICGSIRDEIDFNRSTWNFAVECAEKADKNGQLKRDLVYRKLVKIVTDHVSNPGWHSTYDKIRNELKNIPPLED